MDEWMDGQVGEWTTGWMDRLMDRQVDGWVGG